VEERGFSGIYCASFGDGLGLCEALCFATERIPIGTAIVNLYTRHVADYALTASLVHELSGGRFHFGVGVSHAPMNERLGLTTGRPLSDMRDFVEGLRAVRRAGELPPVVVAGLRRKMVALAGEVGDGVVFANVCRSHLPASLAELPEGKRASADFFVGNMIPVCISDDREAAMAKNRQTLTMYLNLPNYRNYWREAGYDEEMDAVEKVISEGRRDEVSSAVSERWLADTTLFGSVSEVREGLAAWYEAGLRTPILVPSSAAGNQMVAFQELFAAFEG
jgi:alkanesulfonate monooxygenase SsuD/methylene tetrahydromethanopterin reductase-like flavin-dependent oxidoreductase (luciferase family)